MACPQENNIEKKRLEKRTNYRQLAFEIRDRRPGFKVKVVPLVISVFGDGLKGMLKELEKMFGKDDLGERIRAQMQKTIFFYVFQYKLLNNLIYFNKKLFQFGIISQSKFSFCELYKETPHHIFYECTYAQNLWNRIGLYFSENFALPVLNPQSAIFGFNDVLDHNFLLVNHLLLIFKCNIPNSRVNNSLCVQSLKYVISQIKCIEETISNNDLNEKRKISNKLKLIDHLFLS